MPNLTDIPQWEASVIEFDTGDLLRGGAGGEMNRQPQQLANRTAYLQHVALTQWANDPQATVGLEYGYFGGVAIVAGAQVMIAAGTIALVDNATNYVERSYDGVVFVNQVGFTKTRIALAVAATAAGRITAIDDWRPLHGPFPYYAVRAGEVNVKDTRYSWGTPQRHGYSDGTTLDRDAVNDALTSAAGMHAAGSVKYATVVLGDATYDLGLVSPGITVPPYVSLDGEGAKLLFDPQAVDDVAVLAHAYEGHVSNFMIERKVGQGHAIPATALLGIGLQVVDAAWGYVQNVEVDGFRENYDILDSSYLDVYSPVGSDYLIGLHVRTSNSAAARCTAVRVHGGQFTCAAYSDMAGTRGILVEKGHPASTIDGIIVMGTVNEGPVERKLLLRAGVNRTAFRDVYWDAHNGGTDIEFEVGTTGNLVSGGSAIDLMTVLDNGTDNRVEDPVNGDYGVRVFRSATITQKPASPADTTYEVVAQGGNDAALSVQAEPAGGASAKVIFGDNVTKQKGRILYGIDEGSVLLDDRLVFGVDEGQDWAIAPDFVPMSDGGRDIGSLTAGVAGAPLRPGQVLHTKRHSSGQVAASEAALVAGVDAQLGNSVIVTLTANRVVGAPANALPGQLLTFIFIEDAVGGHTVSFAAAFKVSWSDVGNAATKRSTICFIYDGVYWTQVGTQSPFI